MTDNKHPLLDPDTAHAFLEHPAIKGTTEAKLASYLQQENEVLIERVRLLEISLSSEREACAKVAEEYWRRPSYEAFTDPQRVTLHIASLIRGRGEK